MEDDYSSRSGSQSTAIPPTQLGGLTRFYEKEFPDLEECVIVKVRSVAGKHSWPPSTRTLVEYVA